MLRLLVALVSAALLLAPSGLSTTSPQKLSDVASWLAMRPVSVKCYEALEDASPWGYGAWGYVNRPIGKARFMHLDARLCAGAEDVNGDLPIWQRAIGVEILAHEAYHMRRSGRPTSEAWAQCQAIRHWRVTAIRLGATEDTLTELWPMALADHYERSNLTVWFTGEKPYYDENCVVPDLLDLDNLP